MVFYKETWKKASQEQSKCVSRGCKGSCDNQTCNFTCNSFSCNFKPRRGFLPRPRHPVTYLLTHPSVKQNQTKVKESHKTTLRIEYSTLCCYILCYLDNLFISCAVVFNFYVKTAWTVSAVSSLFASCCFFTTTADGCRQSVDAHRSKSRLQRAVVKN